MRTGDGVGVVLPRAVRGLRGEALEAAAELQRVAVQRSELDEAMGHLAGHLRDLGVSWGVIGWSVGTTSQAAQKRWGKDVDEDQVLDDRGQVSALGGYTPRNR